MYRVTCDNQTIYDPRSNVLQLINPRAVIGMGVAGTMTFKIPQLHPYYNALREERSILRFYQDDILLWRGRIRKIDRDKRNTKSVSAEGDLTDLNCSIQPYTVYHDISLRDYLQTLLDIHNEQVEEDRRFVLGSVTVEDPNDSLYRYSTYESTYTTITDRLVNRLGGYLVVRYSEDGTRYLDYLKEYGRVSGQKIAYGKNLADFSVSTTTTGLATVLIPLGAKLEDAEGNLTEERLTVAAANNGSIFIEDAEAVERYGRIVKTVIYDDVTLAENLLKKGYADLAAMKDATNTFKLRAVDLSLFDIDVDKIFAGDLVAVESAPHMVSDYIEVSERQYYLAAPESDVITMNKVRKGIVDTQLSAAESLRVELHETHERVNVVTQKLESYKVDVQKDVDNLSASVTETQTQITTTTENIYNEISGVRESSVTQEQLEEVKSTVIQLNSDNVEMRFSGVSNLIDELGVTVEEKQRLLEQYIRFEGARMELGRSDSIITAVLQNDRLSFLENGQEVAYISNLTLYVTEIHVLRRLRHGDADSGYYDEVIGETGTFDLIYTEA